MTGPSLMIYQRASAVAGVVIVIVGVIVLLGWLFQVDSLKSVLSGFATMKFNTAFCFVLIGTSLYACSKAHDQYSGKLITTVCASLVLVIAILSLAEYALGQSLGIDELVVRDVSAADSTVWPGRMSIGTAFNFTLISMALLLIDVKVYKKWRPAPLLALVGLLIGGSALLGYVYGIKKFLFTPISTMALHTSLLFVVAGFGVMLARPDRGFMEVITSDRVGGHLARITLPAVILLPATLSWLSLQGFIADLYSVQFGFALSSLFGTIIFVILIWATSRSLNQIQERMEHVNQMNSYLAAVVASSDDAIFSKDINGVVTSWNPGAARIYGYSEQEMIGQSIVCLIPPDCLNEERQILDRISRGERIEHIETQRRRKDGRLIDVSITMSPIIDNQGRVIGASHVGRDITESKRNEERIRVVVESMPNALIMVDAEGQIVLLNSQTEKLFGHPRELLLGQTIEMLIPNRWQAEHPSLRKAFFQNPSPRPMGKGRDLYGLHQNGTEFPVEIALSPMETSEGLSVLCVIVDITERKRGEEILLKKTSELARSNQDLEQFAYVASHDLQEPLRAVSGCVQLLQKRYKSQLDERADEIIGHAVDGAARMQKLIEDLLAYSRVGRVDLPFQKLDCEKSLNQALKNLATAIQETGTIISHDDLPTVPATPGELTVLFQNLIGNAVKFRRKNGPTHIHIAVESRDREWLFSVRDNGIGIDPQHFERIFAIFQRLHTRREYPGTGIGLALCKRIVERHGGRIWVESIPGQGTTFFFTLPIEELTAHPSSEKRA